MRLRFFPRDMFSARPVASFAGNTQNKISFIVPVAGRKGLERLEKRGVTLQTAGDDGTIKIGRPVPVSGTIDSLAQHRRISDRQLKEFVIVPKQVALPFPPGPDHHIEPLGA